MDIKTELLHILEFASIEHPQLTFFISMLKKEVEETNQDELDLHLIADFLPIDILYTMAIASTPMSVEFDAQYTSSAIEKIAKTLDPVPTEVH